MMRLFNGHADVQGREHGEHEGLDVGHQTFQKADKHTHEDTRHSDTASHNGTKNTAEDENEGHETEYHDMSGRDVGKESYHQHDRFGENANDFD